MSGNSLVETLEGKKIKAFNRSLPRLSTLVPEVFSLSGSDLWDQGTVSLSLVTKISHTPITKVIGKIHARVRDNSFTCPCPITRATTQVAKVNG